MVIRKNGRRFITIDQWVQSDRLFFPKGQTLDSSKLKEFADDNSKL